MRVPRLKYAFISVAFNEEYCSVGVSDLASVEPEQRGNLALVPDIRGINYPQPLHVCFSSGCVHDRVPSARHIGCLDYCFQVEVTPGLATGFDEDGGR